MSIYKTLFETPENKWKTGLGGMIVITILLAGVFNYEASAIDVVSSDELMQIETDLGTETNSELIEFSEEFSGSGQTSERDSTDKEIIIEHERLFEIRCTLSWVDPASSYVGGTNEPDEFKVSIIAPNGDTLDDSGFGTTGSVSASGELPDYNEEDFIENYVGPWVIQVEAGDCGDDSSALGFRTTADTGNNWDLSYSIKYMDYAEETENSES
jgi:hypothetical protein